MEVREEFAGIETLDPATVALEPSRQQSPERGLLLAIFEGGIRDLRSRNPLLATAGRRWWWSRGEEYGSARYCCTALGFDYETLSHILWAEGRNDAAAA